MSLPCVTCFFYYLFRFFLRSCQIFIYTCFSWHKISYIWCKCKFCFWSPRFGRTMNIPPSYSYSETVDSFNEFVNILCIIYNIFFIYMISFMIYYLWLHKEIWKNITGGIWNCSGVSFRVQRVFWVLQFWETTSICGRKTPAEIYWGKEVVKKTAWLIQRNINKSTS